MLSANIDSIEYELSMKPRNGAEQVSSIVRNKQVSQFSMIFPCPNEIASYRSISCSQDKNIIISIIID